MVIVRIWEGLGNQMFQYAYARALCAKGIDVGLDLNKTYDEVFKKNKKDAVRENCVQNFRISLPAVDVGDYGKYDYLYQDTFNKKTVFWLASHSLWKYKFYEEDVSRYAEWKRKIKGNYYIKGWFHDERYFKDIRNILSIEFVPKKKVKISREVKNAINNPESVSIHVRRGDFVNLNHTVGLIYYEKAIAYINQIYEKPIFLIFSDDLDWTKRHLHIRGESIYVNENGTLKDYEELFIMSRCKSNIIANSTFSWWAAWLNSNKEKTVITPKNWVAGQEHIIPDGWMIL